MALTAFDEGPLPADWVGELEQARHRSRARRAARRRLRGAEDLRRTGRAELLTALLCYCRQGFEPELAGELTERAAQAGIAGYARTERDSGYVRVLLRGRRRAGSRAAVLAADLRAAEAAPAGRTARAGSERPHRADAGGAAACPHRGTAAAYGELVMEHPDTRRRQTAGGAGAQPRQRAAPGAAQELTCSVRRTAAGCRACTSASPPATMPSSPPARPPTARRGRWASRACACTRTRRRAPRSSWRKRCWCCWTKKSARAC